MLKIANHEVVGWEHAIRGMRNPKNSWDQSDSCTKGYVWCSEFCGNTNCECEDGLVIGPNDKKLMETLRNAGTDHRKFMRMLVVYLDITAPLYWWKEFKTYRAGRKFGDPEPDIMDPELLEQDIEMNSCSTMHKIHAKEFTLDDFSHEHLVDGSGLFFLKNRDPLGRLKETIEELNFWRMCYVDEDKALKGSILYNNNKEMTKKDYWWQMIQLLPSSYNQTRTVMLSYETLANIYRARRYHKLDEWHTFCDWIQTLPYSELITGKKE